MVIVTLFIHLNQIYTRQKKRNMLKQDDGNHHYGTSKMNSFPEMIVLKLSCKGNFDSTIIHFFFV